MTDPAPAPMVMTREQFKELGRLFTDAQVENRSQQKLAQAATGINRCDGLLPESVRGWLRALDGWKSENVTNKFVIELAKLTATGDLLEGIRRKVNGDLDPVNEWSALRQHVVDHFLSACESIKFQTMLENIRQRVGETTPAYIRRFRADAERAYTEVRAPTEEARVVASFLRGLADRPFSERLFRTGRTDTLTAATTVVLEKEA